MPVRIQQFCDSQKLVVTFDGPTTISEVVNKFRSLAREQASENQNVDIIWDFSHAQANDLSFEIIDQISTIILDDKNIQNNTGKSAYVIDERAEKHLLNYLLDCLQAGDYKREVRLFQSVEQAKQFLSFPED